MHIHMTIAALPDFMPYVNRSHLLVKSCNTGTVSTLRSGWMWEIMMTHTFSAFTMIKLHSDWLNWISNWSISSGEDSCDMSDNVIWVGAWGLTICSWKATDVRRTILRGLTRSLSYLQTIVDLMFLVTNRRD